MAQVRCPPSDFDRSESLDLADDQTVAERFDGVSEDIGRGGQITFEDGLPC
jgi:hypothetical protein